MVSKLEVRQGRRWDVDGQSYLTNLVCSKSDTVASNLGAAVDVLLIDMLRIVSQLKKRHAMTVMYLMSLLYSHTNAVPNHLSTTRDVLRRYVLNQAWSIWIAVLMNHQRLREGTWFTCSTAWWTPSRTAWAARLMFSGVTCLAASS